MTQFDSLEVMDYGNSADIVHQEKVIATVTLNGTMGLNLFINSLHHISIRKALVNDYNDNSILKS